MSSPDPALRRLIWQTLLGLVAAMVILGAVGWLFREPVERYSEAWVEFAGGWAVLAAYTVLDTVPIPVPHDAFGAVAMMGGMPFWEVVSWASVGSLSGANLAYLLGRKLRHTAWFKRRMATRGEEAHRFVARYGMVGVAVGALTPLPFSVCCQAAGALEMPWHKFMLTVMLRPPRVALYLGLVQIGFLQ